MKLSQSALPWIRTTILLIFVAASLGIYGYFWTSVGGKLPPFTSEPYTVTFQSPINENLVAESQVTLNGVPVGRVTDVQVVGGMAQIQANFRDYPEYAPLHEGVTAQVKTKTLINETYIDLTDGRGAPLPTGTVTPPGNVQTPVDVDDVLRALPSNDRQALGGALQSLSGGLQDNQAGISQVVGSLGKPTGYIPAALKALDNQEQALRQLTGNTATVLDSLDTRRGQIAQLVTDADRVTQATAGSANDVRAVLTKLPPTLVSARNASDDLSALGAALQPVAANLNASAGPLNTALTQLPATSADLRGLLPTLDQTLVKAPPTLTRVPTTSNNLLAFIPGANGALDQLNPVLAQVRDQGPFLLPFFTKFGAAISGQDRTVAPDYQYVARVAPIFDTTSLQGIPLDDSLFQIPGLFQPLSGLRSGNGLLGGVPGARTATTQVPGTTGAGTTGGATNGQAQQQGGLVPGVLPGLGR